MCTIVNIEGSFSRRLGAQLAVGWHGDMVGSLADGCLEQQLRREAERARTGLGAFVMRFGKNSLNIDFRLPCGSGIDILIDTAPDFEAGRQVLRQLTQRRPATLDLNLQSHPSFLQRRAYIPQPRLVVLGTGREVTALVDFAQGYGVDVECRFPIGDAGPGMASLSLGHAPEDISIDPWTAIVILFHDHEWERMLLPWALRTDAFFVGVQGGQAVREEREAMLQANGLGSSADSRFHSPVGLIPRTREPDMLALSIFSHVMAEYDSLHPHR
ncbi:XdhC family protein [uncultured Altererythrobacter sp.]|uniref:XdhC family protein n=1 Tax=uncultured Altererythrobacter sp. TaxID=500840 RepID=UPI0025E67934|nr:XdhC family protein [uncultured Altererythrobacter sp.]